MKKLIILLSCLTGAIIYAQTNWLLNKSGNKQERIKEWYEKSPPLEAYGRVVDVDGNPVSGVELEIHVDTSMPPSLGPVVTEYIQSGTNGEWHYKTGQGSRLGIYGAKKPGYETITDRMDWHGTIVRPYQNRTEDNPVIIILRKKGDTRCLLTRKMKTVFIPGQTNAVWITLTDDKLVPSQLITDTNNISQCDLGVTTFFKQASSNWIIAFSSPNTNSGLLLSNHLLYEAPDHGYQQEFTVPVGLGREDYRKHVLLYIKSRNPPIYSRIDAEFVPHREIIYINYNILANPYGDRILEEETDLPYDIRKKLEAEAVSALAAGRLPEKPDLEKIKRELGIIE
jgi:hypothetical protein